MHDAARARQLDILPSSNERNLDLANRRIDGGSELVISH